VLSYSLEIDFRQNGEFTPVVGFTEPEMALSFTV